MSSTGCSLTLAGVASALAQCAHFFVIKKSIFINCLLWFALRRRAQKCVQWNKITSRFCCCIGDFLFFRAIPKPVRQPARASRLFLNLFAFAQLIVKRRNFAMFLPLFIACYEAGEATEITSAALNMHHRPAPHFSFSFAFVLAKSVKISMSLTIGVDSECFIDHKQRQRRQSQQSIS